MRSVRAALHSVGIRFSIGEYSAKEALSPRHLVDLGSAPTKYFSAFVSADPGMASHIKVVVSGVLLGEKCRSTTMNL